MLPAELVELIVKELDIDSLCVLSQVSSAWSRMIEDTMFEQKLRLLCPWFEPQHSHRRTWRACAFEYSRRQREGSKFARRMNKVDLAEFEERPRVNASKEFLDETKLAEDGEVYTSRHGIRVDLSKYKYGSMHGSRPARIVSLPQVVVVMYRGLGGYLVVKFSDSDGLEPDIVRLTQSMNDEEPFCHIVGKHVFFCYEGDQFKQQLLYVNEGTIIMRDKDSPPLNFTCYDGLLLFFKDGYYCSTQVSLERKPKTERWPLEHQFMFPRYGFDVHGSRFYVVEDNFGKSYTVDDTKGLYVCAVEVKDLEYQVISDATRRELDEVNDSSRIEGLLDQP
ncbi:hypothetical protein CJU89_5111 [Yarrowia sp. B02]|nr:hypothetical protein CJU89_5111 [Yarrowia sp. B02]